MGGRRLIEMKLKEEKEEKKEKKKERTKGREIRG